MFTFNPFGETIEENGSFYTPWQFTGQYLDQETGQYYLRARQYSPYISRFTGRDLIIGNFDDPMTLHKYLYCQNDPINNFDLNGRWAAPVHNKLIDEAFADLPTKYLEEMHGGSAFDDLPQFQTPKYAYMHGMTDATTGQSVEEAQKKMRQFMAGKYAEYRKNLEQGNTLYAYNCLGQALHPIMDQTAPAHSWKPWGGLNYLPHVTDPFLDENDKTFKDTVKRMRNAMMSLEIGYELGGFFKLAGWL
jgi:RHS repeat-associated protein